MAPQSPMSQEWRFTMSECLYRRLHEHLFPGDGDEHGAVVVAGLARSDRGVRLLARDIFPAEDGRDYVAGTRGYRQLSADFVAEHVLSCRDERLVYLVVHNHGGAGGVSFSSIDVASHERGYPALLDVARGLPVGALVFAEDAVAGDIWLPGRKRVPLTELVTVGHTTRRLRSTPWRPEGVPHYAFDRQVRLLGDMGQALLGSLKVGVIGAGGVGSVVIELLGRLGVGTVIVVDPERVDTTNLPRMIGAPRLALFRWLTDPRRPSKLRELGRRLAPWKTDLAARQLRRSGS